ncbi:hypothetical protein UPYG_G00348540 [Umbra pygmaea]|uniref:Leptin n=1 Tax=Umbra pygmaea TaxID=75934 RepID=A0ABD0VXZ4_UMBPY
MRVCVVLAYLALRVAVSECNPIPDKQTSHIEKLVKTTMFHMNETLKQYIATDMEFDVGPLPPIQGLSSIWSYIGVLERSLTGRAHAQVTADVSSLRNHIKFLSEERQCPVLVESVGETLKTVEQSLVEGQKYMNTILQNPDKFMTC